MCYGMLALEDGKVSPAQLMDHGSRIANHNAGHLMSWANKLRLSCFMCPASKQVHKWGFHYNPKGCRTPPLEAIPQSREKLILRINASLFVLLTSSPDGQHIHLFRARSVWREDCRVLSHSLKEDYSRFKATSSWPIISKPSPHTLAM